MNRRSLGFVIVTGPIIWLSIGHPISLQAASEKHGKLQQKTAPLEDPHMIRANQEAQSLRRQVDAATKSAFEHGYHACCITPACSWCLLHLGQCTCAIGVGSGRYVCRECRGGWEANQGRIPGKTKNDVRRMKTITADFTGKHSEPIAPDAQTTQTQPAAGQKQPVLGASAKSAAGDTQLVTTGAAVYESQNCKSCHKMNGQGGESGPDLTHEAQRHTDLEWQIEHLKSPQKVHPGSQMPSFAALPPDQLKALATYLITRK